MKDDLIECLQLLREAINWNDVLIKRCHNLTILFLMQVAVNCFVLGYFMFK